MKLLSLFIVCSLLCFTKQKTKRDYVGSTPAHGEVRDFLDISLTDSIDFIRWKLAITDDNYQLDCSYGVGKAGTSGFIVEQRRGFTGHQEKTANEFTLHHGNKTIRLLEINPNLLYLLDKHGSLLVGNGGFSYVLNRTAPIPTSQLAILPRSMSTENTMVFQGRTPCQELSKIMGEEKGPACDKMKWYIALYLDSVSGRPSYYLKGGMQHRKETMTRGNWEIRRGKDGRMIFILDPEKKNAAIRLIRGDDNILFFIDPAGNLLVGNENFSYTLNRTRKDDPR